MNKQAEIERRTFLKKSGLCAATIALLGSREAIAADDTDQIKRLKSIKTYLIERHAVMHEILSVTLRPEVLEEVYQKFGRDCASCYGAVRKTEAYKGNLEEYLQEVPSLDKWQEEASLDKEKNLITITGTKREECVCSMARASKNPDWCKLCCAGYQKAVFENLLGKEVEVTMGETVLLGGERCNHFIKISEKEIQSKKQVGY